MSKKNSKKKERQELLIDRLKEDPFLTDEELVNIFNVSIQTIRLDRLELGIPELRRRIKDVAKNNYSKVRAIHGKEIIGELVDIELGKSGISILQTNKDMSFEKTNLVKGHNIYSQAESLAMAVIDAETAITGVANVKYYSSVLGGTKLIAKANVVRIRDNRYFVHVFIYNGEDQVFRGKFTLVDVTKEDE